VAIAAVFASVGEARAGAPAPVADLATTADPEPKNVITLEPLAVVFARTIAVEYERGIGRFGLHLGGAVTLGGFDAADASGDYLALGVTLGVRFYPWSEGPIGAFVGPFGSLGWVSAESGDERASGLGWSVGAMAGWTWVFGSVFALSLGAGAVYSRHEIDPDGPGGDPARGRSGFFPATRLGVGAAF